MTARDIQFGSNHPVDLVARLSRAAGWSGDDHRIALAAPHLGRNFTASDYAETLRNLGLTPHARRADLDELENSQFPCLYRDRHGRMRCITERGDDGFEIIDENARNSVFEQDRHRNAMVLGVHVSEDVEDVSESFWQIFAGQRLAIATIVLISILVNLLALAPPAIVMAVYDKVIPTASKDFMWALVLIAIVLVTTDLSLRCLRAWTVSAVGVRIERRLARALFRKMSMLPTSRLNRSTLFLHSTRIKQFDGIRDSLTSNATLTLIDIPLSAIFLAVIFNFSINVGLIILAIIVLFVGMTYFSTRAQNSANRAATSIRNERDSFLHQIAVHRHALRNLGLTHAFASRAESMTVRTERAQTRQKLVQTWIQSLGQATVALAGVASVAFATLEAMSGAMSFGGLIVVVSLVWRTLAPFQTVYSSGARLLSLNASIQQVDAVLAQDEEMRRDGLQSRAKTLDAPLECKNIFLRFDTVSDACLSNISLRIERGQLVVLTGASGAGKTCLLNVFSKLFVPGSGTVMIDSIDYRQLAVDDIRGAVSLAPQERWLFDLSIRDNLRLGNPTLSEARIMELMQALGAERDIKRLHDGLDTMVDNDLRARLTTIQLQTLNLVRALSRPASVFLLDDAMVGLSPTRAALLWSYLQTLRGDRTVVVVTNHLDQMAQADRVICMDRGRVVLDSSGLDAAKEAARVMQSRQAVAGG